MPVTEPSGRFVDDNGHVNETKIEALAAQDIAQGCDPPANSRFCPQEALRRDRSGSFPIGREETVSPEPPPQRADPFTFTAGGDIGARDTTTTTLEEMAARQIDFFLALGDLSYRQVEPESAWCDYVASHLGADFPVQLIVGNHENDSRTDGYIGDFTACLPDRMHSQGTYGAEYYFDVGDLARIIMIGAGNPVDGVPYYYHEGSSRMAWLETAIDQARDAGRRWVIVGMHHVCLSAGVKTCEIGSDLMDKLIEKRVDLVLAAHDHNYQRSKQLRCGEAGRFIADCVTDDGTDGVYPAGEGTVFVISGLMGGGPLYRVDDNDPEYPYMAVTLGAGDPLAGYGFPEITVDDASIEVEFVGTTTTFTDSFSIGAGGVLRRIP